MTGRTSTPAQPARTPSPSPNVKQPNSTLSMAVPPELLELVAVRAAELVAERQAPAEDGWLRGAEKIAAYLDCSSSRIYALVSARRIPVEKDGSALIARRRELDEWVREGGDRCP